MGDEPKGLTKAEQREAKEEEQMPDGARYTGEW